MRNTRNMYNTRHMYNTRNTHLALCWKLEALHDAIIHLIDLRVVTRCWRVCAG